MLSKSGALVRSGFGGKLKRCKRPDSHLLTGSVSQRPSDNSQTLHIHFPSPPLLTSRGCAVRPYGALPAFKPSRRGRETIKTPMQRQRGPARSPQCSNARPLGQGSPSTFGPGPISSQDLRLAVAGEVINRSENNK